MIGKALYWLFKKQLDKSFYENQTFSAPADKMEYKYTDSKGVKYYHWPNMFDMPWPRFQMCHKILLEIEAGLPGKDLPKLREALRKNFNDSHSLKGEEKDYAISYAGALFVQWQTREKGVILKESFFELVAACLIAEDQDPGKWDITRERNKALLFMEEAEKVGTGSFFLLLSISGLNPYLKLTEEELNLLLDQSEGEEKTLKRIIDQSLSKPDGKNINQETLT